MLELMIGFVHISFIISLVIWVLSVVIVGIGISLNSTVSQLSSEIQKRSTLLQEDMEHCVYYHEFLTTLLTQFDRYYTEFVEKHYTQIIEDWKTTIDTPGKTIQVHRTETVKGIVYDVDHAGFLLLKINTGAFKKIMTGDCLYFDEL